MSTTVSQAAAPRGAATLTGRFMPVGKHAWLEAARSERTRWITALLGFFLVMDGGDMSWWPLQQPPAQFALAGLALIVLLTLGAPARGTWLLVVALGAIMSVVLISTALSGNFIWTRLGTISAWILLMYGVARGALSMGSLARGMGLGLFVSVIYGVVTLESSSYTGRLTGLLGDPNTAGLALVTLGLIAMLFLRRRWIRWVLALTVVAGVILTASRTSMLALGIAAVVILIGHRLHPLVVTALVWISVWWLSETTQTGASAGSAWYERGFFLDREGSDILRSQLASLEEHKRITGGLFGHGPGEAHVMLDDTVQMFSHNSYSAFQLEFGQLGMAALMLLGLVLFWRYTRRSVYRDPTMSWAAAAVAAAVVCSASLGESLLTPSGAVAAGTLILVSRHARIRPDRPTQPGEGQWVRV
ncbi:hypothetical protein [Kocuria sp.]|uniref:hypothetical protein n=1 Tax=Kocuria sp. TaxID=1871328 RepID=UPI0026DF4B3B|nr:hypothetical protein [Kocuria sp.]MDO5619720.1 hypothetical protein [Kocuria sp.]